MSEPRIALAKKGSFTKMLWLTQGLQYEMRLSGTRYTFRRYK